MQKPIQVPEEAILRVTAAAVRALSRQRKASLIFGAKIKIEGEPLELCAPPNVTNTKQLSCLRGHADTLALYLSHHDKLLAESYQFSNQVEQALFDTLERIRVEVLGSEAMPGVAENLRLAFIADCHSQQYQKMVERGNAPLADAVALLVRESLLDYPIPATAKCLVEVWRNKVRFTVNKAIDELRNSVEDQAAYARASVRLISELGLTHEAEGLIGQESNDGGGNEEAVSELGGDDGLNAFAPPVDRSDNPTQRKESLQHNDSENKPSENEEIPRPNDLERADLVPGKLRVITVPRIAIDHSTYHAFTTEFDEIVDAKNLGDAQDLTRLRTRLDDQMAEYQFSITRLANRLQRLLQANRTSSWEFDMEEGLLDPNRLSRLIVNPMYVQSYRREKQSAFPDTVVSLLIDNSGSMRGRPITVAAVSADIFARTLEQCGMKVEILGFTTRAWKGGDSRKKWLTSGKSSDAGRVSDLRHIIYKSADAPWRKARKNIGMMLSEGVLKENIDGEALIWAHDRLARRKEQRKVLIVISDGAPVDDSTLAVNPRSYLDRHLHEVITAVKKIDLVELMAIGIGYDVSRFYDNAVTISDPEQLGATLIDRMTMLFSSNQVL